MSTDKKKFFGKHKEGGKQKGAVKELGSNVYVIDVGGATENKREWSKSWAPTSTLVT
jgi:hypothetical protein